ncbi:MAG: glutaredoxin [Spirochaetaceae bacterium]|nr:MAG: glutaredoxin [Spirochaetaceae bacterium]
MIPQIIGTKKSAAYRACLRYCRERGIAVQERNPDEKPLSPGELDRLAALCGGYEELLDREGSSFRKRGLAWMDFDPREEILQDPSLLRRPIVRTDRGAAVEPEGKRLEELLS